MAGTKANAKETLESCVDLIQRGIDSGDPAIAKEGKFYFHLGDALNRLGRTEDANKVRRYVFIQCFPNAPLSLICIVAILK